MTCPQEPADDWKASGAVNPMTDRAFMHNAKNSANRHESQLDSQMNHAYKPDTPRPVRAAFGYGGVAQLVRAAES